MNIVLCKKNAQSQTIYKITIFHEVVQNEKERGQVAHEVIIWLFSKNAVVTQISVKHV